MIAAALLTGLRSDLPRQVTAQVTENVHDSATSRILLIPQGDRLVGQYDAQVAFGQSRGLLVWSRLIMPNGRSIVLERQPGADPAGYADLEDQVDDHWGMLFEAAVLSTLLSVGTEAGTSDTENSLVQAIRQGASQSVNQVGEQIVGWSLNCSRSSPFGGLSGAGEPRPRSRMASCSRARPGMGMIAPMIARFMATDLAFAKLRRPAPAPDEAP